MNYLLQQNRASVFMTLLEQLLNTFLHRRDVNAPLKALLFDSWFDEYRGVVCLIAVKDGVIKKGDVITWHMTILPMKFLNLALCIQMKLHGCTICRTSRILNHRYENNS